MGRSRVAVVAAIALGMGGFAIASVNDGAQAGRPAPDRPNVVLVMTDDQTQEQMAAMSRVRRLIGREGTTFTRSLATYPLCCPSRATYLTGQYPHNHGVESNRPPAGGYAKLDGTDTLPVWLRRAGYATAHIGKYLNGYGTSRPREVPPGWQEWQGSVDPTTYNFRQFCLNEGGRLVAYGTSPALARSCPGAVRRPSTYQGDLYTERAVRYVRSHAPSRRPFFLSVAYLAPHSGGPNGGRRQRCRGSAQPAPRHAASFRDALAPRPPSFDEADVSDKPAYIRALPRLTLPASRRVTRAFQCRRASLLAVDEGVERIVAALRRSGELDDTLFVFTADNGFFSGEHRVRTGKIKPYEPSVRVPLLVRGPGVPRDRRVRALAANVDLAATIVDAAKARPGHRLDGLSLLDLARRPRRGARRAIVLENGPGLGTVNPSYRALRTDRFKWIRYASGERELYDLARDPFELRSRHADPAYRVVRRRLDGALTRLRGCAGAACRRPVSGG